IVPTEAQITIARERLESNPAYTVDDPRNSELLRRLQLGVAAVEWSEAEVPDPPPDTASDVPGILCSSHILVETEAEATDVLGRLDAGEEFGALAIELSIDPGSGQFGGGLGCLLQGSLVPEFEAAAYAASPGDVVGPVQSQFGFHVIEVLSVGPPTAEFHPQMSVVELAQLQGQASSAISPAQAEGDAARAALLRDIQDTALTTYGPLVVIDPAFGVWDESSFQVVPPAPVGSGSGDDGG
ncbi:MAG: peptidylprolyl isomerase, partial [Acidimicrobiales bacterium]